MDIIKFSEKLMVMNDEIWMRHSNPWSVYTRFSTLPLLSCAFWSREWFGAYSLIFIGLSLLWIWLNPRVFNVPDKTNNWASMGTFGERIYLNRRNLDIPEHHLRACNVLHGLAVIGLPVFVWSLFSLNIWLLLASNVWIIVLKAWFVDRMVWLYLDMKDNNQEYQSWYKT